MYCSYKSYKKSRKVKRKCGKIFKTLIAFGIIAAVFAYYKFFISQTVINYALNEINSIVTASVNKSVLESLNDGVKYEELVTVQKDNDGNVALIETNAYKTNYINREIAFNAQKLLASECKKGVYVPIGAFTGVSLVSGFGKNVKLNILDSQSVECHFQSFLETAGINQTRHAIYISVDSTVSVVLPMVVKKVNVKTEVLLCDAVIVGKIPEVYLGKSLFN